MTTQGTPRLGTVTTLRRPFGFIATSDLPTRPTAVLTFTIPSEDWRQSEVRAWATARALEWATARQTVIVGVPVWGFDEMTISATVNLTTTPRDLTPTGRIRKPGARASVPRPPAPHDGCALCEDVAAFPDNWKHTDIAAELRLSVATVHRHRIRKVKP